MDRAEMTHFWKTNHYKDTPVTGGQMTEQSHEILEDISTKSFLKVKHMIQQKKESTGAWETSRNGSPGHVSWDILSYSPRRCISNLHDMYDIFIWLYSVGQDPKKGSWL